MNSNECFKICLLHNGCDRRSLDTSRLAEYFRQNGCKLVRSARRADFIVFMTCAFIKNKEDECFEIIRSLNQYKGELIVAGCLPAVNEARFKKEFKGRFVTTRNLKDIDALFKDFQVRFESVPDANTFDRQAHIYNRLPAFRFRLWRELLSHRRTLPGRISKRIGRLLRVKADEGEAEAYLRVCWGCSANCSYCSIREAVGEFRSKPLRDCLREYEHLLKQGYKRFAIAGDNVGAYGNDIGSSLVELLERMADIGPDKSVKWRLQYLNPEWLVRYRQSFVRLAKQKRFSQLQCPIQSGNPRILKLMNRFPDQETVESILNELREADERLELCTNIIVGFPSETEEEFSQTIDFILRSGFDYVWLFTYSLPCRADDAKPEHVTAPEVIRERVAWACRRFDKKKISYVHNNNIRV